MIAISSANKIRKRDEFLAWLERGCQYSCLAMVNMDNSKIKLLLLLVITICLASCKEKADVNKLYNDAEEQIELKFKYANVNGTDYSSVTEDDVYHVSYDKIRCKFRIWTIRFADIQFNETYEVRFNKLHSTETQICLSNSNTRVIIENAGYSYIVHLYKVSSSGVGWDSWVTFHNSNEKVQTTRYKTNNEESLINTAAISNNDKITAEELSTRRVLTVVYATSDDGFVNVREQPSSKAKVLEKLYIGIDGIGGGILLDKGDSWCKVSVKGVTGWVYTKYIGFQTWYKGTGNSILVANTPQTPIFENADVDENEYKFAVVEKGTIIADSYKDIGKYYALFTNASYLYVKKEDVKIVTRN